MVQIAVTTPNVDPDKIYLVIDRLDLLAVVEALHSVGNVELAQHFEAILRQGGDVPDAGHWWRT